MITAFHTLASAPHGRRDALLNDECRHKDIVGQRGVNLRHIERAVASASYVIF